MNEGSLPRKRRWGWLKRSHSDHKLPEESGIRAASGSESSLPHNIRGLDLAHNLNTVIKGRSARTGRSPNSVPTATSSSSSRRGLSARTSQEPSPLIALVPEASPSKDTNSGTVEVTLLAGYSGPASSLHGDAKY
ncbi:hypothetical protein M405DRAFT_847489 [Rhizopogon salebrosus TDB-379]|nr:hypothetical protein M405DRAFT_847489 [Rhizopogon salebrosus TDB-379]